MATAVTSTDDAAQIPEPIPCAYPPAKPPAHVYDTIITVAVGPNDAKKKFKVYRGLLCHFSSYFDRMLNGSFKEGGSNYLRLKDVDAKTFNVFYYWLNSGVVDCMDNAVQFNWAKVVAVYVFADFHQAPVFKNAVLESLHNRWLVENSVYIDVTNFLYTNTSENDAMRRLVVDMLAESCDFQRYKHRLLSYNKEFLIDIIVACREQSQIPDHVASLDGHAGHANTCNSFCERYHTHREREAS